MLGRAGSVDDSRLLGLAEGLVVNLPNGSLVTRLFASHFDHDSTERNLLAAHTPSYVLGIASLIFHRAEEMLEKPLR